MSLQFPVALVLSIIGLTAPVWADFQAGVDAAKHGDYATALRKWRPLAEQGNAVAQFNLGLMYNEGHGVPEDYVQARQWWEKAANQGHASAQASLGTSYLLREGVSGGNYQEALRWFRLAADQGHALAQGKLGMMFHLGLGVPQDFVQAYMWYDLAAADRIEHTASFRDALAKQMTPAQIAEAQKLARDWKPKESKQPISIP